MRPPNSDFMIGRRLMLKNILCAFAILFACVAPIFAQASVTGTWRLGEIGAPFLWQAVLIENGQSLTGIVSSCSGRKPSEISGGKVDGERITFQCTSEDG